MAMRCVALELMVDTFDGKDVDFSPYVLKSLETIEMGLPAKL